MNKIIKLSAVLLLMVSASSCKKYLDVQPVGKVIPTTVEDFRALLNSGYTQFPTHKSMLAFRTDELLVNEQEPSSSIFATSTNGTIRTRIQIQGKCLMEGFIPLFSMPIL